MKKIALFALACASVFGTSNVNAQEVTYVEDCSQGLLLNRMQDNWFISLQGGPGLLMSNFDTEVGVGDRIGGSVGLFGGKWFTPVFGARVGVSALLPKGATTINGIFRDQEEAALENGSKYYPEKFFAVGPEVDLMINLTNWICGYKPGRIYNAVLHGGAGGYWTFNHVKEGNDYNWDYANNRTLFMNLGLQNNFAVSKQVDLFIDVQYTVMNYETKDIAKDMSGYLAAQVGFTYKFKKRDWNCPITAVCPTWKYTDAEGDALVARLANADNKIKNLQRQLDECLNRPQPECECVNSLATIYYPINVSSLSAREKTLVQSIANEMKKNPNKKYVLTGWADNYTGNDEINTRLRNERVEGVKKVLLDAGVAEDQISTTIDAGNLTDFGIKGAQFDRAVTIVEAN